jgi:hypothetical protein
MTNTKIKKAIELLNELDLSNQDKVIVAHYLFNMNDRNWYHNYSYRELLVSEKMGLSMEKGIHGLDTKEYELKSVTVKPTKDNTINIRNNTKLGELGRSDKDNINDNQDIVCSMFTQNGELVLSIIIKNDDNYKTFKNQNKDKKRKEMSNFNNVRDTTLIKYKDIKEFNMNYDVILHNNNYNINFI